LLGAADAWSGGVPAAEISGCCDSAFIALRQRQRRNLFGVGYLQKQAAVELRVMSEPC